MSHDVRTIFWLAALPGALAAGVLVFGVREAEPPEPPEPATAGPPAR